MAKKTQVVEEAVYEEVVEQTEPVEQIVQITSWDQLVEELAPGGECVIPLKNGKTIKFKVNGMTKPELEAIEKKYEKTAPKQPSRLKPGSNGVGPVRVYLTEGPGYDEWKVKNDLNNEIKACELLMLFVPENLKPKVDDTLVGDAKMIAQAKLLNDKLAFGSIIKIITAGYEASGINMDDNSKVEQAKNF